MPLRSYVDRSITATARNTAVRVRTGCLGSHAPPREDSQRDLQNLFHVLLAQNADLLAPRAPSRHCSTSTTISIANSTVAIAHILQDCTSDRWQKPRALLLVFDACQQRRFITIIFFFSSRIDPPHQICAAPAWSRFMITARRQFRLFAYCSFLRMLLLKLMASHAELRIMPMA